MRALFRVALAVSAMTCAAELSAQRSDSLSGAVRRYVTVSDSVVALTRVTVIDGTGATEKQDQTIILRNGRIAAVGPRATVRVPAGAKVLDLPGHTVIPGLVGMHDHLFYTAAG